MRIRFIGCGDAFGSGGRFHTCLHVAAAGTDEILLDLGASAFHALKASGLDLNRISTVLVSHFHGDHFGGLPYFLLDAQFVSQRRAPLTIAGPPGVGEACTALFEASYPGLSRTERAFPLRYRSIAPDETAAIAGFTVTARAVAHDPNLAHAFGYRLEAGGRTFAFSGDTAWTDALIPLGRDADLFVVECYVRSRRMKVHLDYATLKERLPAIGARRVVLTHMSNDVLDNAGEIEHPMAYDGLTIEI